MRGFKLRIGNSFLQLALAKDSKATRGQDSESGRRNLIEAIDCVEGISFLELTLKARKGKLGGC